MSLLQLGKNFNVSHMNTVILVGQKQSSSKKFFFKLILRAKNALLSLENLTKKKNKLNQHFYSNNKDCSIFTAQCG